MLLLFFTAFFLKRCLYYQQTVFAAILAFIVLKEIYRSLYELS